MAIKDEIQSTIDSNDVVLFMKGTPVAPQCGFSAQLAKILSYLEVPYKGVNVLADTEIRDGVKQYANWPTIPQLYVKGEFVGGADIVKEMFEQEELVPFLTQHGVALGQMSHRGYGKTRPIATNATDEGRAQNRRVEIANPACRG